MSAAPSRKPMALYAITVHGLEIARRLSAALPGADLYVSTKLMAHAPAGALPLSLPMGPTLTETFTAYDCHVFVISVGAVVRMIAPLLVDKKVDPAVVCVDDAARFAICVLSGHVGRGNAFTDSVAEALGAVSVVTTASDVRGTLTVDILGRELGWRLDDPHRNVTRGCAAVVNEARVLFVQEAGDPAFWPLDKPLPKGVSYTDRLEEVDPSAYEILLVATDRELKETHRACWENAVIYRPPTLVVGMGCDRGTPEGLLERGLEQLFAQSLLSLSSVRSIATIDVKADEPGLLALCARRGWKLETFNAQTLDAVEMPTPSQTVKRHVGTRGVCEPAALLASGASQLLVEKRIYTEPDAGRSMTLAVARVPHPSRKAVVHG